jgi:hypothetical protein
MLFLLLLLCIACRERTNIFDVESGDFEPLPPIVGYSIVGAYNSYGYLIGVNFEVRFKEPCSYSATITHILYTYHDDIEVASAHKNLSPGHESYTVNLIAESVMGPGHYYIEVYFGEFNIGYCVFEVVDTGGGCYRIEM